VSAESSSVCAESPLHGASQHTGCVQVGGQVDPLRVIQEIPDDLELPRLTQRLGLLMKRFRTTVQLKQLCNDIIDADCIAIATRLLQRSQEPLRHMHLWDSQRGVWELYDAATGALEACDPPHMPRAVQRFAPPAHTQGLSMRAQVAAHLASALDSLQVCGGRMHIDGMHAMVEPATQQCVRQQASAVAQSSGGGVTLWTE
jgi:hypothetical protein